LIDDFLRNDDESEREKKKEERENSLSGNYSKPRARV